MDDLGFAMPIHLGEYGKRTVFFMDALELCGDDVGGFIPGNAFVFGRAARLRVALSVRIPINPLQRVRDAILGIDALFVSVLDRGGHGFGLRLERSAILCHDLPRPHVFHVIFLVVVHRANAKDLPIFNVNGSGIRSQPESTKSKRLVYCLHIV